MKIYIDYKHQIVATEDYIYEIIEESDAFKKYLKRGWKESDGYDIFKSTNPNADKFKYEELPYPLKRCILGELLSDFLADNFKEYEIDNFNCIYETKEMI